MKIPAVCPLGVSGEEVLIYVTKLAIMNATTNTTAKGINAMPNPKPAHVEDAAAWDAGFTLGHRNSPFCAFYYMEDAKGHDIHNGKGERICVEVSTSFNPGGKSSMPRQWHKLGYTPTELQTWWSIQVYVTDADGICFGKYNPQVTPRKNTINFKWMKEATPGNLRNILKEVSRQFLKA